MWLTSFDFEHSKYTPEKYGGAFSFPIHFSHRIIVEFNEIFNSLSQSESGHIVVLIVELSLHEFGATAM